MIDTNPNPDPNPFLGDEPITHIGSDFRPVWGGWAVGVTGNEVVVVVDGHQRRLSQEQAEGLAHTILKALEYARTDT